MNILLGRIEFFAFRTPPVVELTQSVHNATVPGSQPEINRTLLAFIGPCGLAL